jgi:hypothetical protein
MPKRGTEEEEGTESEEGVKEKRVIIPITSKKPTTPSKRVRKEKGPCSDTTEEEREVSMFNKTYKGLTGT